MACIDEIIIGVETIRAFVRALRPRGSALYDSLSVIPANIGEEMATRIKSYIELEIAEECRKAHKDSNKDIHEGKKSQQRHQKGGHQDDKRRPW